MRVAVSKDGSVYSKVSVEAFHTAWGKMGMEEKLPYYQRAQLRLDDHISKNPRVGGIFEFGALLSFSTRMSF